MPSIFQESIEKSLVDHPWKWGILSFIIIGLPQWLSGTWALWSDEPLFRVMATELNMSELPFSLSWITLPIGLFMLGYLAYALQRGKRHGKLGNSIQIYERNTYNWDHSGDPNIPTLITSDTVLRKPVDATNGEALLTPLIGNESPDVIALGAKFVVGINYTQGTLVSFGPHTIWRSVNAVPISGQRFIASLDESVLPGRLKVGPDEMIRAKLPVGKYQVTFAVQGRSEKGQIFTVERSCHIEIYGSREDQGGVATRTTVLQEIMGGDPHQLGQITSPLKIEFDGADVRSTTEAHPTFSSDQVTRRFYGVRIRNDGSKNINNVSLEVEKIEQIPDRADEIIPVASHLGLKFLFKLNNKPTQDFSPQLSDRVPIISHVKASFLSHIFKMASTQKYEFPHNNRRHRIHVKVTGSEIPHISRTFIVWVDGGGNMKMTGE